MARQSMIRKQSSRSCVDSLHREIRVGGTEGRRRRGAIQSGRECSQYPIPSFYLFLNLHNRAPSSIAAPCFSFSTNASSTFSVRRTLSRSARAMPICPTLCLRFLVEPRICTSARSSWSTSLDRGVCMAFSKSSRRQSPSWARKSPAPRPASTCTSAGGIISTRSRSTTCRSRSRRTKIAS